MIIRARTVVTMDGAPIENGAVAVSGNQIADVGKFDEIAVRNSGEIIDLGEQALLPGLINAHCHLDYTCLRGKIPPQKSFADWIRAINACKAKLSPKDYLDSINEGFAEAKRFGTTTIANLTAFPELVPRISAPIRTWWFAEMIDVRTPDRAGEIVDRAVESLKSVPEWGLAPHALFTASKNLYRSCEEIAQRDNILLTTHLAESLEEMEMFREASGPLYEFLKAIGRPMDDCGNRTALELFLAALGDHVLPQCIVVHLNEVTESDCELLQRLERRFHVTHSPRSHDYFKHSRFPFEKLRSLGFNTCLGTDSLASNDSLSLFDEMRAFQKQFLGVSPEEILQMVTVNAARALQQQNALGRISRAFRANLITIPSDGTRNLFEDVIAFDGAVDWVMVDGKI
jgi:cytosine/adenosine deaminase-related metal-dependent hydrolase